MLDIDKITEDYYNGLSSRQIAKKYQCSKSTILNKLNKAGVILRSNSRKNRPNSLPISSKSGLLNQRFGGLLVIEYVHGGCKCLCDCGKEIVLPTCRLLNKSYRSCGCRISTKGANHGNWKGIGHIPNAYFLSIKHGAERRNLEFSITMEYIDKLLTQQDHKCNISGSPIKLVSRNKDTTASLDRIDSSQGYIEGNVQWIHKAINTMKWDSPQEDFIKWCKLIAKNN